MLPDTGLVTAEEVATLKSEINGPVIMPGDSAYAAECAGYNLNNQLTPPLVVGASSTADVQAAVQFATRRGMAVAVKSSGHQVVRSARQALLITTGRMPGITVDPALRLARVGSGASSQQVIEAAAQFGLAPITGSAPGVGAVGFTLGGGLSPVLGRSFGYAADHVNSLEMVTADGSVRRITADLNPDLFWAARDGKGNFGVVTAMDFDLFPVSRLYGGGMYFAGEQIADVLHTWRQWVATIPEGMTSSVAVQRLPPAAELPDPLQGAFVVHVRIAYLGSAFAGERLIAPLRSIGPRLVDTVAEMPYTAVGSIHLDPLGPLPYYDRTTTLREFPAEAADALIEVVGPDSGCSLAHVEIRSLGGALDWAPAVPNAVGSRGIPFMLFAFAVAGAEQGDVARGSLAKVVSRLEHWSHPRLLPNFLSADEATTPDELRAVYGAELYERLSAVKETYDPSNTFRMNHNIAP